MAIRLATAAADDKERREPQEARLLQVFADPVPLPAGAEVVGNRIAVLPVLFHLMWTG